MQIVRYTVEVVEIVVLHRVGGCSSTVMVKMWGTLVPLKGSKMIGLGTKPTTRHLEVTPRSLVPSHYQKIQGKGLGQFYR